MAEKDKMAQKVNLAIASFALFIAFLGVIGLLIYTGAAAPFGVGLLAAIAAGSVGLLFGLLFGVPRAISSGQVRQNEQAMQAQSVSLRTVLKPELLADSQSDKASSEAQLARAQKFSTSTNLAEVRQFGDQFGQSRCWRDSLWLRGYGTFGRLYSDDALVPAKAE